MSTLEDVLSRMCVDAHKSGIPFCTHPMTLHLWLDTDQNTCAPITGSMNISFEVNESKICDILRAINSATPIVMIKVKRIIYHITKIEEFMNKRCEI